MLAESNATVTVADLVALIERTQQSVSEAGRPDLAEVCHVVVTPGGEVRVRFAYIGEAGFEDPTVMKALTLDPIFEHGAA